MSRTILLIFSLLFSLSVLAEVRLELIFPENEIKQGSLQEATLQVGAEAVQEFEIQKLKNLTANDTLYFHKISPLLRNNGAGSFTSTVTVIFLKVPESSQLSFKVNEQPLILDWNEVSVIATEASKGMIFENFDIPGRRKIMFWVLILLSLMLISFGGYKFWSRQQTARKKKEHLLTLKDSLISANNFEQVIGVWQRKFQFIEAFPHTAESFKQLEKTLFKHVFKPQQNEQEKLEVVKAYRDFVNNVQGGFNGI